MNYIQKKALREFLIITAGTCIIGTAVFFGLMPAHVSVGSISGLAVVLSNLLPLPVSAITLGLNLLLLLFGFLTLGGEFGIKTVYASVLLPGIIALYENLLPNFVSLTNDQLIDTCIYIFVVGPGLAMLFSCNASSGGLDIIAKFLNKYCRIGLGTAMTLPGLLVALSSALVYDGKTVVLSLIGTYTGGLIIDKFIFGLNEKMRVCIITKHFDKVRDFIVNSLRSGATVYEARGAYTDETYPEIITIVDKGEYRRLIRYLREEDPEAFLTVYSVKKIACHPKKA